MAPITTHSPVYRRLMEFRAFVMETACIPGKPPFSWRALPDNVTPRIGDDAYPFSCLIFDPVVLRPSAVRFPNPQVRVFLTFSGKCPGMKIPGIGSVCGCVRVFPGIQALWRSNRRVTGDYFGKPRRGGIPALPERKTGNTPAQSAQSGAGCFSRAISLAFACCSTKYSFAS